MPRVRRIRRKKPRAGSVWKKLLLWGVLGMLVLAAAAVAGSYLYVRAYLKSDGFLAMLEQSAVDDMNVETARIDPLDWDGSGIRCGGVTMEGHEFLTSLQARNIETEFSRWELLKRAFVITSVNIAELKLQLAPVPFRFREKPEGARSWAEENILPDTFRLEKGSIDSLSVSYGEAGRPYVLDGTRVESAYDAGSSQYRFEMQGGRLLLPFKGCPEFSLMSGTAQFNHASRRVNVPSCRLTTAAGGYLDIKGDWDGSSSSWTANMVVNGVPASSVLEGHWKKHVQGSVSGGIDLRGGRDGVTHVAGLARLQGGMLTGLPVLDRLGPVLRFFQIPESSPARGVRPVLLSGIRLAYFQYSGGKRKPGEGRRLAGNRERGGADRKAAGGAAGRRPVESSSGVFRCVFRFPPGSGRQSGVGQCEYRRDAGQPVGGLVRAAHQGGGKPPDGNRNGQGG